VLAKKRKLQQRNLNNKKIVMFQILQNKKKRRKLRNKQKNNQNQDPEVNLNQNKENINNQKRELHFQQIIYQL